MSTEQVIPTSKTAVEGAWRWGGPDERPNPHISYEQSIRPYHRTIAQLVEKYGPVEGELIEIGCGIGRLLGEVQKRCPRVKLTGTDIDAECLRMAGSKVRLERTIEVTPDTDLVEDFGGQFDVLVCSHVLEHTSAPAEFLKRHLELLKPGGIACLAVPNPVRPDVIFGNLLRKHYVNRGHVCTWDRSHWMNFLENILGLEVIAYAVDYVPLGRLGRLPGMNAIERALASVTPWFSFSNIAVVRVGSPSR